MSLLPLHPNPIRNHQEAIGRMNAGCIPSLRVQRHFMNLYDTLKFLNQCNEVSSMKTIPKITMGAILNHPHGPMVYGRPTWQAATAGCNVVGTIVQEAAGVRILGNSTRVMAGFMADPRGSRWQTRKMCSMQISSCYHIMMLYLITWSYIISDICI